MDVDFLFSSPRWKILEVLVKRPSSPLEISKIMKVSVAYVSQQLKLLEAAGIVAKEKTGSVEKGMPRNVYSLINEILYLTALVRGHPAKKALKINEYQKSILNIWMIPDEKLHYILEKFYWNIENEIKEISALLIDVGIGKCNLLVVSESKKIKQKLESFFKPYAGIIDYSFITQKDIFKQKFTKILPIYDPHSLLREIEKVKGGENQK